MSGKVRTSLLSLTIIAVLMFSAIGPTIVYADDGQPPDTTAPHTVDSESDNGDADKCDSDDKGDKNKDKKSKKNKSGGKHSNKCSPEETTDTSGGESESNDAEPAADTNSSENAPDGGAVDAPATDTAPADLLSQVPENTSVTVLNAEGQPEPLVTQDAANAIATTTDPIWCPQAPVGQPPTPPIPGANGCTPSFTSFDALLTFLAGNAGFQGAGTIYVEQGAYGGGESSIDFNNYNLSNISSSDLTVQGGWDPATNTTTSTSNFTVPIIIGSSTNPWGGSLTISNLVITGAQSGFTLYAQNDITLVNVQVTDSVTGAGAELNAGSNVNISNSKFLRNNTAGAIVSAGGNVAIANSEFSNTFNQRRQIKGLDITSIGSVSLFNVLANGNRRVGANINAGGRVTIGSSVFSETNGLNGGVFYGYGLQVVTPDAIDLTFVTANNNFLWGADLDAGGDVTISNSIFNANSTSSPTFIDDTGLLVTSGGRVTLNNVQANDNRLIGAVIDAVGAVNINSSTFSNNQGVVTIGGVPTYHGLGLGVVSLSSIFLNGVTASGNGVTGTSLNAGGAVTISSSTFSNTASTGSPADLLETGLMVVTPGNALLDTVTADNNGDNGAEVTALCTGLVNGSYSGNGQYGLFLVNPALSLSGSPVFAGNGAGDIFPASPAPCTLFSAGGGTSVTGSTDGGAPTGNNTGSSSNASSLQQAVSYSPVTSHSVVNGTSIAAASLNSMFTGITREVTADAMVTSIFVGNYIYVYTIYNADTDPSLDNLQIILVTSPPLPVTSIAMVGP